MGVCSELRVDFRDSPLLSHILSFSFLRFLSLPCLGTLLGLATCISGARDKHKPMQAHPNSPSPCLQELDGVGDRVLVVEAQEAQALFGGSDGGDYPPSPPVSE